MKKNIFMYSNWASVASNFFEFNIVFKRRAIDKADEFEEGQVSISMSPQQAKAFSLALEENIAKYEKGNETINLPKPTKKEKPGN